MQMLMWSESGGCAALAGVAVLADRRRSRRLDPDRVGWVPWPLILILSLVLAAMFVALALQRS